MLLFQTPQTTKLGRHNTINVNLYVKEVPSISKNKKNREFNIMWEIKPTSGKYDCFLGPIISYAESCQIDYELGLLTGWGFFCAESVYVPIRIGINLIEILENIHGIFLDRNQFTNKHELFRLLEKGLLNGPVMISVNAIDCPWCLTYEKYSMHHYILVLGMQDDILCCIDSYFTSDGVLKWDISQKSWAGDFFTFRIERTTPKKEDYLYHLNNAIDHVKKNNMIEELKKYRDNLMAKDSFTEEIRLYNNDYYAMPILIAFQHLYMARYNNARAIEYIGQKLHEEESFAPAADAFVKTGKCYEAMKSILIKQIITNKVIPTKIQEKMNDIIEAESMAIELLEKFTNIIE